MKSATNAAELWAALTSGPRPSKVIDFPRKKGGSGPDADEPIGTMTMVVLTQGETMAANTEAEKEVRKLLREGKEIDYDSEGRRYLLQNASAMEIVWRSLRDAADPTLLKPLFMSKESLRKATTPDEIGVLMNQYLMMRLDIGPIIGEMSEDEMEAWLDTMARVGIFDPLGSASQALLIGLVIFSAKRLRALRTANSSAGSQPEDTVPTSTTKSEAAPSPSSTG